jgi:hypothetical protein
MSNSTSIFYPRQNPVGYSDSCMSYIFSVHDIGSVLHYSGTGCEGIV